jgi:hypothetical protein
MGRLVETCAWAGGAIVERIPEWAHVEALSAWGQAHATNLDVYVPMFAAGVCVWQVLSHAWAQGFPNFGTHACMGARMGARACMGANYYYRT